MYTSLFIADVYNSVLNTGSKLLYYTGEQWMHVLVSMSANVIKLICQKHDWNSPAVSEFAYLTVQLFSIKLKVKVKVTLF